LTSVEPTRGARSMAHAAFSQTGVDAPAFTGPGQRMLPGTAFSYAGFAA
jgi:hypothetical protein